MIEIANGEAIIQLITALNLAYFSFREIRSPVFNRHADYFKKIWSKVQFIRNLVSQVERPGVLKYGDDASHVYNLKRQIEFDLGGHEYNLSLSDNPFSENTSQWDDDLRKFSLAASIVGFGILYVMSIWPEYELEVYWYTLAIGFCLIPSVMSIFYNVSMLNLLKKDFHRLNSLNHKIEEIEIRVEKELIPAWEALSKSGLE